MSGRTFFILGLMLVMGAPHALAVELEHLWTLEGLSNPESVALGPDGQILYVSNVAGDAGDKDGEGFISRVSLEGELLELRWVEGLNAPKGVASDGNRLFVSDIDEVVTIHIGSAEIVSHTPVPGAVFLNDAVITPEGHVLVSDSGSATIFEVIGTNVTSYVSGDWLGGVNGLLFEEDKLLISTMDTNGLFAYDPEADEYVTISRELGQADGIAILGGGYYLISEWPGRLFHVTPDGQVTTLLDTRGDEILINDFLLIGDLLVVPNWQPGTLTAYRVSP